MKFPKYFEIDGTLVKLDSDGKEVFGLTASGFPYPPLKAMAEGREVTKEEYGKLSKTAKKS